ncbi:MAG: diacylglycerol kinase family lipid kinase [Oscillospiraceae bacterium]|nr:diacylglycerol kinase family lipid kinase [Oscillospiraceae bacterium]
MRHLFIINPAAGKHMKVDALRQQISDLMRRRDEAWTIELTEAPGHAEALARQAADAPEDGLRVYALGGDGTLNEVVNGVAGRPNVAVGCCPLGSGNDFIKLFNVGRERFRDLAALVDAGEREVDLIRCNDRYSINICSVGFDARIGLEQAEYKKLPLVTGKGAYLISLVVNTVKGIHRPYRLELDGEPMEGDYTLIAACNGRWYGGSFNPAPDALPDDGLLDFIIVEGVSRLTVANLVLKYAKGRGKEFPDLIHMRRGRCLKVWCDRSSMVNVDGERLDADSLSFSVSANRLRLLVPSGAHW